MSDPLKGSCFCGAVQVEVSAPPVLQGYCHCGDCRRWSATPVTAYALFPSVAVQVTEGQDQLIHFSRDGQARRAHCGKCGGAVMTELPANGLTDVYPPTLDGFTFEPECHIRYGQRMIDIPDGLPKFRDMPVQSGGTGELIPD